MIRAAKRWILAHSRIRDSVLANRAYVIYASLRAGLHWRFERTRLDDLAGMKRSDTLVILGSGESVNAITDDQWAELSQHDVVGFSYSCLLPIKHTIYFFEVFNTEISIQHHLDKFLPIIREKQAEGWLGRVIWKNPDDRPLARRCQVEDFERMISVNLLSGTAAVVAGVARSVLRRKLYRHALVQHRGSVFGLVLLAGFLGYKRVLLCGVDLRGPRYFFESAPQYAKYGLVNPLLLEDPGGRWSEKHHASNDPRAGVPIAEALEVLCAQLKGTECYVASAESALAEFMPVWQWHTSSKRAGASPASASVVG